MKQKPGGNRETVFWNHTWVSVAGVRGGEGSQRRQQLEHQAEATTETTLVTSLRVVSLGRFLSREESSGVEKGYFGGGSWLSRKDWGAGTGREISEGAQ